MLGSYCLVQVWVFWKLLSGPSLSFCSKTPIATKHYKNSGFSTYFGNNVRTTFWKLLSGPSWRFLKRTELGPDNNFQLGPDNNFQKCTFFCYFLLFKMGQNTYFIVLFFFENLEKWQKCPQNDSFSHFAKHRLIKTKKALCCNPPLDPKLVFSTLHFLKKNIDVEQKTKLKSGKNKDKERGFE